MHYLLFFLSKYLLLTDLDTAMLYRALKSEQSAPNAWTKFVWKNKAPPRVKFFAWLLSQERIKCKTNLIKKHIVDNTVCEACQAPEETTAHILEGCPKSSRILECHSDNH